MLQRMQGIYPGVSPIAKTFNSAIPRFSQAELETMARLPARRLMLVSFFAQNGGGRELGCGNMDDLFVPFQLNNLLDLQTACKQMVRVFIL
jgi:hypothetical protein